MNVYSVVVYLIQNSDDLRKLFVIFSHLKSFLSLRFSTNTNVYIHSQIPYNIRVRVVSDIQPPVFGSSFYIRYKTATHFVNSTYSMYPTIFFVLTFQYFGFIAILVLLSVSLMVQLTFSLKFGLMLLITIVYWIMNTVAVSNIYDNFDAAVYGKERYMSH